jgi:uncharacterized protein (TIGR02217 family)
MSGFLETPRFDDTVAYWARGGPGYSTKVVINFGGYEARNQNWDQSRAVFDITNGMQTQQGMAAIISMFRACKGMAYGFRFKDFQDYAVALTGPGRGQPGLGYINTNGHGNGTNKGQLYSYYAAGANSEARLISKPCASPAPAIYVAGVLKTVTTDYTIDTTTGVITWVSGNPTSGQTTMWVGQFDVPVRFDTDELVGEPAGGLYQWQSIKLIEIRP